MAVGVRPAVGTLRWAGMACQGPCLAYGSTREAGATVPLVCWRVTHRCVRSVLYRRCRRGDSVLMKTLHPCVRVHRFVLLSPGCCCSALFLFLPACHVSKNQYFSRVFSHTHVLPWSDLLRRGQVSATAACSSAVAISAVTTIWSDNDCPHYLLSPPCPYLTIGLLSCPPVWPLLAAALALRRRGWCRRLACGASRSAAGRRLPPHPPPPPAGRYRWP